MKPVKINEQNIMFTEPMGDTYDLNLGLILGVKFNYLIDTGLGGGSVAPVLEYLGGDRKPVIVINTHYHWDHMWGNWAFKDNVIIAHTECCGLIEKYWDEAVKNYGNLMDGEVKKYLPNLLFDSILYFPCDGVKIFHSPGHSSDSVSVYHEPCRVLYAGDNIGDTADEIVPHINTDKETFRKTLEVYRSYNFDICVSGHNKPQGKEIIDMMDDLLDESWEKQV